MAPVKPLGIAQPKAPAKSERQVTGFVQDYNQASGPVPAELNPVHVVDLVTPANEQREAAAAKPARKAKK